MKKKIFISASIILFGGNAESKYVNYYDTKTSNITYNQAPSLQDWEIKYINELKRDLIEVRKIQWNKTELELINRYNISLYISHRHYRLEPNEIMLEDIYKTNSNMMSRKKINQIEHDFSPKTYVMNTNNEILAMEYTTDPNARKAFEGDGFFGVISKVLLPFSNISPNKYGITITDRNNITGRGEDVYFETSTESGSLIELLDPEHFNGDEIIQVSYPLANEKSGQFCDSSFEPHKKINGK